MTNGSKDTSKGIWGFNIVWLILGLMVLVGARFWLEKEATAVPYPYWLAASANGIAILYGDAIYVCNAEGDIINTIAIPDHILPCQLSWHENELLVADWENDKLHLFSEHGMTSIKLKGGPVIHAHLNVIIDENNNAIYVTDSKGHQVHTYDSTGSYRSSFGSYGRSNGALASPKDIRFLNDTLYVGNVIWSGEDSFSTEGNFIDSIVEYLNDPLYVENMIWSGVDAFSTEGNFIDSVVEPKGNSRYNQITDFDLNTKYVVTIECDLFYAHCLIASYGWDGELLSTIPQTVSPTSVGDIAIRSETVYVSDTLNRKITKYYAATLDDMGPLSSELNALGENYTKRYLALKRYSWFTVIALILGLIPLAWFYWQYKKSA
jgi:hypothetical protein